MPRSQNERKAAERKRRRAAGLVKVEVYVRPEHRVKVREHAERLNRRAALLNINEVGK